MSKTLKFLKTDAKAREAETRETEEKDFSARMKHAKEMRSTGNSRNNIIVTTSITDFSL